MFDRKSILILTLIMSLATLTVGGIAIGLLYHTAFEQQRHYLREVVQSQARLMEAVAHFDAIYSKYALPGGSFAATMSQIRMAHDRFERFGETSTFLIGQRQDDRIEFLLNHQVNDETIKLPPVPWEGDIAEPMRRALSGESGVMEGFDYRGVMVLAAYEPVAVLNLGMVAKVDLAALRAPFIRAGGVTLLIALAIIALGTGIFHRVGNRLIRQLTRQSEEIEQSHASLARAQQIAHVGNWEWDIVTGELSWSDEIYRIFGLEPQAFSATYEAFLNTIHPDDREKVQRAVSRAVEGQEAYAIEHRIVRPDGAERQVLERGEVRYGPTGEPLHMTGTVLDITEHSLIEEQLKKREEQMRSLLMSTGEAIYGIDLKGNCTFANEACAKVLGYDDASDLLGKNIHALAHHTRTDGSHYPMAECNIHRAYREGRSIHIDDELFWRADGESFPVEFHAEPIHNNGNIIGAVVSFSDITQRKATEEKLRLSDRLFRETSEAIIITRPNGTIIDVNDAFVDITGWPREEILGQNPRVMKSDKHDADFYQGMWQHIAEHGWWSGEIWDKKKDGEVYPKWMTINAIKDEKEQITHYIGIFSDITKAKAVEHQLHRMAFYDGLTGLPNRALCRDRLEHEIKVARRHDQKLAVLYLDLDRFKYVNDTLGHASGDLLLLQAAQRIQGCVREEDTVARLGGDEFAVILSNLSDTRIIQRIASNIIARLSEQFIVEGNEVNIGVSAGISLYPDNGEDHDTLTKNADTAMYKAKEAGRNTYRFFTDELHATIRRRLLLEKELRAALQDGGLSLHYQPKVDMHSGRIIGMEALLRWSHPVLGNISPLEIIPIAEDTGLIMPLGNWVLRQACAQNAAWIASGYGPLRMAVNLSARQFEQKNIAEQIEDLLLETGLAPEHLELEITESMVMRDPERAVVTLSHLRRLGVQIAVDDFGTGYSSLAYLKQFPIHSLKIDKSFVEDLGRSADAAPIASAIISMATSLKLSVVAEGVETREQMEFLRDEGCSAMQGYYYSRPLPAKAFSLLLATEERPDNITKFRPRVKETGRQSSQPHTK